HHEIARLGRGVDASRLILPEAFDRLEEFLSRYRSIARELGSHRIVAFGTSALRDARNRGEFIASMSERTGIDIEVLSGDDEALWTYLGALDGLSISGPRIGVLDIGGGSTEFAFGDGQHVDTAISVDVGAVRITERFLAALPPTSDALNAARAYAFEQCEHFGDVPPNATLVGVAGTVTTLGAIACGLEQFDAMELNGSRLTLEHVAEITARLSTMTLDETAAVPQISTGRADIILGGATILMAAMTKLGADEIVVSTRGVRYGIAIRESLR
ncbi:MAG: hypothetical protein H7X80_05755, partial [bacterium]|nr:hypothetical protein [Candidatus Kapabacteria bacterium]